MAPAVFGNYLGHYHWDEAENRKISRQRTSGSGLNASRKKGPTMKSHHEAHQPTRARGHRRFNLPWLLREDITRVWRGTVLGAFAADAHLAQSAVVLSQPNQLGRLLLGDVLVLAKLLKERNDVFARQHSRRVMSAVLAERDHELKGPGPKPEEYHPWWSRRVAPEPPEDVVIRVGNQFTQFTQSPNVWMDARPTKRPYGLANTVTKLMYGQQWTKADPYLELKFEAIRVQTGAIYRLVIRDTGVNPCT
ncbi:hypothetical protein QBC46DRAFT_409603 [Diplogelasinospora grovesii]|uniref:Uncharacterized protein n=1 Tax=Diplogelasinospora grovesii TaxID=303347 RepID=A0AAN6N786_9PEZI|nr:hypothetical protein QBC46DRAFT_409603 [Diplogelasinospora grovesii]